MEGSNALMPRPSPWADHLLSVDHAEVDVGNPVFAGRLRLEGAIDSDPASSWARCVLYGFQLLEPIINLPYVASKPPWRGDMPCVSRAMCSTPDLYL